jgi:hypothetical protein
MQPLFCAQLFGTVYLNIPCQYTPLLNLCPLIFTLTPFGWMHSIMLTHTHFIISYGNIIFHLHLLFSGTLLGNKARAKQNVIDIGGSGSKFYTFTTYQTVRSDNPKHCSLNPQYCNILKSHKTASIPKLCTGWRQVGSFMFKQIFPGKTNPVLTN